MTNTALDTTLDAIYISMQNDNEGLDEFIGHLKTLLNAQGSSSVEMDSARLPQPNRQGRKLLQSYFKKRGVNVTFAEKKAAG